MIRSLIFSTLIFLCFSSKATINIDSVYAARYTKTLNDSVFVIGDLILGPEIVFAIEGEHAVYKSDSSMKQLVDFFTRNPFILVDIIVHTDTRGDANSNNKISLLRAHSVIRSLIHNYRSLFIFEERFTPVGRGENDPLLPESLMNQLMDSQHDFSYWNDFNRRIELKITGFLGAKFYENQQTASDQFEMKNARNPAYYEDLILIADRALLEQNYQKAFEFYSLAADVAPAHERYAAEQRDKVKALLPPAN